MHVLYVGRATVHDLRFVEAWTAAGADVTRIACESPDHLTSLRRDLHAVTREARPDIVHAGPITDIAFEVAEAWDGPLVAASWGYDLIRDVDRDPAVRNRAAHVLSRADAVLVDNDAPRDRAVDLGANPARIVQFPWGVDLVRFSPCERPFAASVPSTFTVLTTRRHEPIYDVESVVEAFSLASADDDALRLVVAGTGSGTEGLRRITQRAGISDRVEFTGEIGEADLPALYASADLYVSASLVDGSSVSLLEAMASLTPVAVSGIPGNAQWVDETTGVTFAVGDREALASIIRDSATTAGRDAAAVRTQAARRRVEQRADWRSVPGVLREVAARLVASRRTVVSP